MRKPITDDLMRQFRETVWTHYRQFGRRDLPWRQPEAGSFDPYKIMVSELMLQQTQVARVIPKYREFLSNFPTVQALAAAPQADVLRAWSGLGYNRRARFLHQAAQRIIEQFAGSFPDNSVQLISLPGIGSNTAGAIMAYAFNQPVVFIETNIRTVFIHHFFEGQDDISDAEILALVEQTLDHLRPRNWYWALMDYGSFLKRSVGNPNRQSRHYTRQSSFHGSQRQIRGQVIRLLGEAQLTRSDLARYIDDARLTAVLHELETEGLIHQNAGYFTL